MNLPPDLINAPEPSQQVRVKSPVDHDLGGELIVTWYPNGSLTLELVGQQRRPKITLIALSPSFEATLAADW